MLTQTQTKPVTLEDLLPFFAELTRTSDVLGQVHHDRTAKVAVMLSVALGYGERLTNFIRIAATVHDIGKVAVHDIIIFKHGAYTEGERAMMERHSAKGAEFLRLLQNAGVYVEESVIQIVLLHHENYDGTGYPLHLKNSKIHIGARVLRIADFYEAITSQNRSYRSILSHEDAIAYMEKYAKHFDPTMWKVFKTMDMTDV